MSRQCDNLVKVQPISTIRKQIKKGEKQSEGLPNYFLGILWKK